MIHPCSESGSYVYQPFLASLSPTRPHKAFIDQEVMFIASSSYPQKPDLPGNYNRVCQNPTQDFPITQSHTKPISDTVHYRNLVFNVHTPSSYFFTPSISLHIPSSPLWPTPSSPSRSVLVDSFAPRTRIRREALDVFR